MAAARRSSPIALLRLVPCAEGTVHDGEKQYVNRACGPAGAMPCLHGDPGGVRAFATAYAALLDEEKVDMKRHWLVLGRILILSLIAPAPSQACTLEGKTFCGKHVYRCHGKDPHKRGYDDIV